MNQRVMATLLVDHDCTHEAITKDFVPRIAFGDRSAVYKSGGCVVGL